MRNHIKFLFKKVLQVIVARNSAENPLLKKHRVKTIIKKLKYTSAGEKTVSFSLCEMECMETLVLGLSYKQATQSNIKKVDVKKSPQHYICFRKLAKTRAENFLSRKTVPKCWSKKCTMRKLTSKHNQKSYREKSKSQCPSKTYGSKMLPETQKIANKNFPKKNRIETKKSFIKTTVQRCCAKQCRKISIEKTTNRDTCRKTAEQKCCPKHCQKCFQKSTFSKNSSKKFCTKH